MFYIKPHRNEEAMTIEHGYDVFKRAQRLGQSVYHVNNASGGDYDLEYIYNMDLVPLNLKEIKKGVEFYPPYPSYDEEDTSRLDLSLLKEHRAILFDSLNEYSVVLGRLALTHTDADVYYADAKVFDFIDRHDRLHVEEPAPDLPEDQMLHVVDEFVSGTFEDNFHIMSAMPLFHSIFFWQSLTDRAFSEMKYACIGVAKNVGIGGVLSYYTDAARLFAQKGLKTFLKKNASRYPDEMLHKYFRILPVPNDADGSNTLFLDDLTSLTLTYAFKSCSGQIDVSILSDGFKSELDQYADAVIGRKKALGVLIRGTDYIVSNMSGARKMATVDEMLPLIREWIAEDDYEIVFLATEDKDILEQMEREFGDKLRVIAQDRHSVSDFSGGMKVLSELEESQKDEPDAEAKVEDSTINYFYALYCLSKCDSFTASGQCHGWDVVNSFKEGKFLRSYKFAVGLNR